MPWKAEVLRSTLSATFLIVTEDVATAPEPVAALFVVVKMEVPAILSIGEELALVDGNVTEGKASVLTRGSAVPVVAVA